MSRDPIELSNGKDLESQGSEQVIDDAALDDTVIPERYDITSFEADYDVEGLVRRLE